MNQVLKETEKELTGIEYAEIEYAKKQIELHYICREDKIRKQITQYWSGNPQHPQKGENYYEKLTS